MLIDAGADTASSVVVLDSDGTEMFDETPLSLVLRFLREINSGEVDAKEGELHSLEAIRRLLLRVDAVHAVSWLWAHDMFSIAHTAEEGPQEAETPSATLTSMLPVLRRRAARPRVLLSALLR